MLKLRLTPLQGQTPTAGRVPSTQAEKRDRADPGSPTLNRRSGMGWCNRTGKGNLDACVLGKGSELFRFVFPLKEETVARHRNPLHASAELEGLPRALSPIPSAPTSPLPPCPSKPPPYRAENASSHHRNAVTAKQAVPTESHRV